jgi:peptidoglycan/xylan/chitin deacetylase (PgdA/CDA1 family)
MELLQTRGFAVVHVSELVNALRARRLSRRTIAVTFDDGYVDNLTAARPILERYQTRATHYATVGFIGSKEPFWWDLLDLLFLRPGKLPDTLEITLGGKRHRWTLGAEAILEPGSEKHLPTWKPLNRAHTRRQAIHDAVWRLLVAADPVERQKVIRALVDWADVQPANWSQRRPMSEDELRELRGDGLVEIGAHSLTHPALSALPPAMQVHELRESKSRLEEILGAEVHGCAYPHGRASPEVQRHAREAGYKFGCGSVKTAVHFRSNPFELPRVSIKNWDQAEFKSILEQYVVV